MKSVALWGPPGRRDLNTADKRRGKQSLMVLLPLTMMHQITANHKQNTKFLVCAYGSVCRGCSWNPKQGLSAGSVWGIVRQTLYARVKKHKYWETRECKFSINLPKIGKTPWGFYRLEVVSLAPVSSRYWKVRKPSVFKIEHYLTYLTN